MLVLSMLGPQLVFIHDHQFMYSVDQEIIGLCHVKPSDIRECTGHILLGIADQKLARMGGKYQNQREEIVRDRRQDGL